MADVFHPAFSRAKSSGVLFDSHCHLDADAFTRNRSEVLRRARASGVIELFIPGVAQERWAEQRRVAEASHACFGLGVHPFWAHRVHDLDRLVQEARVALRQPGVVAVGECGLDALTAKAGGASLAVQEAVLECQLGLAKEFELPVVLHCVRAHGHLLEILARAGDLPAGGVLHAYSGPAELVPRYAKLGFYFGFGGAVTRSNAKRARRALDSIAPERLLLETDAPDQAPAWCAGPNQPEELLRIAGTIAELRGTSLAQLAAETTENARSLFRLAPAPNS